MRENASVRAWIHRVLVGASTALGAAALVQPAEACPIFRGCYEGCFCETGAGDGTCGYDVSHNACGCMTIAGVIHTYDCQVPGGGS